MEEPVSITLWGKINPKMRQEALSFVRDQGVFPSEIELRKAVMSAIQTDEQMQISSALGYRAVRDLAATSASMFSDMTYCQEGYWPIPNPGDSYCEKHNFYFGGILGCHICSGFYRE
jgi:hypothetical protein